jgi:hypothetical protein
MMNEYTGSDVTTKIHEEKWLGDLQATSGRRLQTGQPRTRGARRQQQGHQAARRRPWWRRLLALR